MDQEQQKQAAPAIDPEVLKNAVSESMQEFMSQNRAPEPTIDDMSPEERAEYLQIFDPAANRFDQRFVDAIQNAENPTERLKAIGDLRDGIINQSLPASELLIEQRMAEMQQSIAPAIAQSRSTQAEQVWDKFSKTHTGLANHKELVDAMSTQLAASGYKPKNQQELFDKVAQLSTAVLAKAGVNVVNAPANQQQTSGNQMPRMSQQPTNSGSPGSTQNAAQAGQRIAPFFLRRQR